MSPGRSRARRARRKTTSVAHQDILHVLFGGGQCVLGRHQAVDCRVDVFADRLPQGRPFRDQRTVVADREIQRLHPQFQKVGVDVGVFRDDVGIVSDSPGGEVREGLARW